MGAVCCGGKIIETVELIELPDPDVSEIFDEYQIWEYLNIPFRKVYVKSFFFALEQAKKDTEAELGKEDLDFVTIPNLTKNLNVPSWRGLRDQNSDIFKFMNSKFMSIDGK